MGCVGGRVGAWGDCVTYHAGGIGTDLIQRTPSTFHLQPGSDGGSGHSVPMGGVRYLGCNDGTAVPAKQGSHC